MSLMRTFRRKQQRGFSMMEALVTMLIMGVGLLGASRLVSASLAFTDSAELRSQAVVLAYDLVEKIRANPENAGLYAIDMDEEVGEVSACDESSCSGADIAQADLADWRTQLDTLLPAGGGENVVDGDSATITVQWTDRGTERTFQLVMGL